VLGWWGLGLGAGAQTPNPQSPFPNPQSPIPIGEFGLQKNINEIINIIKD